MAIHLYKTSTPSTRNGAVDSQVKSNPRNNLIYGQHHCGKGRNARGIITVRHRGGGHKRLYRHNHGVESSQSPMRPTSQTLNDVTVVEPLAILGYPKFTTFRFRVPQRPPSLKQPVSNGTFTAQDDSKTVSKGIILAFVVLATVIVLVLLALGFAVCRRRKSHQSFYCQSGIDITSTQSLQFDYKTIETATNKFLESNKIGRGGFGEVFKGVLPDGTEVAVKRLSKTSGQGGEEFKNEAVLVAKLQHRNLVRLLGFVLKGEEKILVYEFVPNKSLDYFLFDPLKQGLVEWKTRYSIIGGIARGILYLHQDSRLIIIHRDLKASNVLLDADMNPKIADFGIARIFGMDQTRAETRRIVGTYGYMSPEYAMQGHFSMKSDVYSFGVLVLEIISGKKTSSLDQTDGNISNLVTYAWRLWREGSPLELVDPAIGENYHSNEATRCIHIALLCVQEDPADRPTCLQLL
ncbi:unnamed protein product [Microthlaspi erraticum]|uniref:Protein kinase domain-containing protein n=1 Tax=Microthlaspi erraticum TaxID=1685480 RepID=A0A6D2KP78_9BRAS|nr:unnamed protein product [Microthlaspi erraticum]